MYSGRYRELWESSSGCDVGEVVVGGDSAAAPKDVVAIALVLVSIESRLSVEGAIACAAAPERYGGMAR